MLHVLDLGANYWSLWTEAENLEQYNARFPEGFRALQQRMGYRIRPAWIWQRKRWGTEELIVGVANNGVASMPGVLRLTLESADGAVRQTGVLDPGQPFAGKIRQASAHPAPGTRRCGIQVDGFSGDEGQCSQANPMGLCAASERGWFIPCAFEGKRRARMAQRRLIAMRKTSPRNQLAAEESCFPSLPNRQADVRQLAVCRSRT